MCSLLTLSKIINHKKEPQMLKVRETHFTSNHLHKGYVYRFTDELVKIDIRNVCYLYDIQKAILSV